jgi:hypothetical protein
MLLNFSRCGCEGLVAPGLPQRGPDSTTVDSRHAGHRSHRRAAGQPRGAAAPEHRSDDHFNDALNQLGATCWVPLIEGRLGRSASPQKR